MFDSQPLFRCKREIVAAAIADDRSARMSMIEDGSNGVLALSPSPDASERTVVGRLHRSKRPAWAMQLTQADKR